MDIKISILVAALLGALFSALLPLYKTYNENGQFPDYAKTLLYWLVVLLTTFTPIIPVFMLEVSNPTLAFLVGFALPILLRNMAETSSQHAIKELEKDLEEAEENAKAQPEKAKPVWEVSRIQLEMYISRNQSQVRSIYWITLFVMLVGFVLIGYGVLKVINETGLEAAILTTCSGIVTEFIGATLLVIYKSTISQAASYVGTLERINSVGMALQIVDQIPDSNEELKNKARAELASKIVAARTTSEEPK